MPKSKKQSKKSKLLTSISLNSNRGRLIVFLLIFAVIGGGIMLYNSFAASTPPIVFSTRVYDQTNTIVNTTIQKVLPDNTSNMILNASKVDYSLNSGGNEVSPGRYSPNHNYIAWSSSSHPNASGPGYIYVYNVGGTGSKSANTKSFVLPAQEVVIPGTNGTPSFAWYPNSSKIALVAWNIYTNTFTLRSLDITTGTFSQLAVLSYPTGYSITTIDVLGNGTFVYTDSGGVKAIRPGTTSPITIKTVSGNDSCDRVRSRPGTQAEMFYKCYINGATKVYRKTLSGVATQVFTLAAPVYANGSTSTALNDFAVSADGLKLAFYLTDNTIVSVSQCTSNFVSKVVTTTYTGASIGKPWVSPTLSSVPNCKGGYYGGVNLIAWSPDNQYIGLIYSPPGPWGTGGVGQLYTVPLTVGATVKIVGQNVVDISW